MNVDVLRIPRAKLGAPICIHCASEKVVMHKEAIWCQMTQSWRTTRNWSRFFCNACKKKQPMVAQRRLRDFETIRFENDWFRQFCCKDVPGGYYFSPDMWKLTASCSFQVKKVLMLVARTVVFDRREAEPNCLNDRGCFYYNGKSCVWEIRSQSGPERYANQSAIYRELWVFLEDEAP